MKKILFIDTETTGLPINYNAPISNSDNWPRLVQLGYILCDYNRRIIAQGSAIIKPRGFHIPYKSSLIHSITTEIAIKKGIEIEKAFNLLIELLQDADLIVGHNVKFDIDIIDAEYYRLNRNTILSGIRHICTKEKSTAFCNLPNNKWPKLEELHLKLFGKKIKGAHDALSDIIATKDCFWKLIDLDIIHLENHEKDQEIQYSSDIYYAEIIKKIDSKKYKIDPNVLRTVVKCFSDKYKTQLNFEEFYTRYIDSQYYSSKIIKKSDVATSYLLKEIKEENSIKKIDHIDDLNTIPNLIGVRDLKEDERLFYELIKSFNRENDDVFFDSKYSYRGDEYDKFVSMIFDYFSPISENIAKFLIVDLVKNTDIDPNTIFNRWVFINLIIKNHFGWYLRTHPDILALTTLSAKEFKEESGTYDALFHRNPDTKEFYLTMENYEVKADSSFVKYAVLNSIEENHKKIPYFQYFEDFEGNYYWEVRMEDSLAPQTSIQEWKNDGILK